jgi:hypothetical protein
MQTTSVYLPKSAEGSRLDLTAAPGAGRREEQIYRAMTVAAILAVIGSVWLF